MWPRYRKAESDEPIGDGVLLSGSAGRGKTHTAFGILLTHVANNPTAKVAACGWPHFLAATKRGYSNEQARDECAQLEGALMRADVALIDDIGAERVTEGNHDWIGERLYVIIDHRYVHCLPTVMTTNLNVGQLGQYLGERLASRILGACRVIEVEGKDRRIS